MLPIVTPAEMARLDAADSRSVGELIELAGWHVAHHARRMMGGVYGRTVLAIAGPGNNGADALVAARLLKQWGARVETMSASEGSPGHHVRPDLIIDGAFGTGLNRPYTPPNCDSGVPVLAVDIPSGVNGMTGELLGEALSATTTVTFEALKPGLLLHPGAHRCGRIEIVDLGLDGWDSIDWTPTSWLFTREDARRLLPRRDVADHKWKRSVWVIGGSDGMHGAPHLAATAVLKSGAGMAWCSVPGGSASSTASEIVFKPLDAVGWHGSVLADAERFGALVIGPGIGRVQTTAASVQAVLAASPGPVVVDGDALRLLGERPRLHPRVVLTPHDGEFEALAGRRPGPDRFAAVRELARDLGATVLLKGPLTIVADPDGDCTAVDHGDERLATAGTGDVLAGVIGSYLAAGLKPATAAVLGAWVHAEAGRGQAAVGMVASDLLVGLPDVTTRLLQGESPD